MTTLRNESYALMTSILWGALLIGAFAEPAKVASPNFIVILVDDQGWAGTDVSMDPSVEESSNPHFVTPNLGRLAEMGLRFSQGYSSAPKCAPARAGLLSGQSPARLRYTENGSGKNQEAVSKEQNGTVICHRETISFRWMP